MHLWCGWDAEQDHDALPLTHVSVQILILTAASLNVVRRKYFNFFRIVHMVSYVLLPLAAWHSQFSGGFLGVYLLVTGTLYMMELFTRYWSSLTFKPKDLSLRLLPGNIVLLQHSQKNFKFAPGQFCYICIPKISMIYHPIRYVGMVYGNVPVDMLPYLRKDVHANPTWSDGVYGWWTLQNVYLC